MPKMNEQPSYGIFDIEYVNIEELRWNEIPALAAKVNLPQLVDDLQLRVSFFDSSLDTEMCPVNYSSEREVYA